MKIYSIAIISNLPIIILKDNINFEIESKCIVVIPADNPVLEMVEAVSKITLIKLLFIVLVFK